MLFQIERFYAHRESALVSGQFFSFADNIVQEAALQVQARHFRSVAPHFAPDIIGYQDGWEVSR